MLLETFFPSLLCLENVSTAHADISLWVIPAPPVAPSKARDVGWKPRVGLARLFPGMALEDGV